MEHYFKQNPSMVFVINFTEIKSYLSLKFKNLRKDTSEEHFSVTASDRNNITIFNDNLQRF